MSDRLFELAKQFSDKKLNAEEFVENYQSLWKMERNNGSLLNDSASLSELLSSIFCMADLYNPDTDRESYEFNEHRLQIEIAKLLAEFDTRAKRH